MKKLCVASNMFQEVSQLPAWFEFVHKIADGGIVIVDTGSKDGTQEFIRTQPNTVLVEDSIIIREGYGPSRNHLRASALKYFPDAQWLLYLDADERIFEKDFHKLRHLKDYLIDAYDVIALPRIDWRDNDCTTMAKDWVSQPDYQARMTRLTALNIKYIRKLHEQITGYVGIYADLNNPVINHFHRTAGQDKRDRIGKLCSFLHESDSVYKNTYPKHHKEEEYYQRYLKEGL